MNDAKNIECDAMAMSDELISYLVRQTGLPRGRVAGIVAEVVAYFDETPEAFVRRRHRELQVRGDKNPEIFAALRAELAATRFRANEFSERQLRRIVYG